MEWYSLCLITESKRRGLNWTETVENKTVRKGWTEELRKERIDILSELWKVIKKEEHIRHQKSRVKWLNDGDKNFKFLHCMANNRRRMNFIGEITIGGVTVSDPRLVKEVVIEKCHDITSLSDHNSSFKYATDLRCCCISRSEGIECLVSSSSFYNILQSIEKLDLFYLVNFSVERDRSAASTPPGMFSRLKHIRIWGCPKIDKLFWPELVHNLQNLEQIQVNNCEQLAEIISTSDGDEENKEEGKDFTIFTLPKLREMSFGNLP
ncbi:hypothetical protein Ddye_026967 [Dipteronia dyeriana]|uniref:Disease resistance protein At4g27190-like leucine-rich repeats domain-containing protein n=1 Tax=Dipteronia dyeriana TaxID=168575 RepID=A0AAD9TN71_9ROSI|nr:hypothetical protein Ddye_026967 [Dipteronia dyeriana]